MVEGSGLGRGRVARGVALWTAAGLVGYFVACGLVQARGAAPTYDEPAHLAAGYSYWRFGDFRMNPEHPPGLKLLAALPLLAADPWPQGPGAARSRAELERLWGLGREIPGAEWTFAHELFFGATDSTLERFGVERTTDLPTEVPIEPSGWLHDVPRLFLLGRLPMLALGLLLVLAVGGWAYELFGPAGGLTALALAASDPNLIAHSALVTTDVGLALFAFLATWALWRFRRRPGLGRAAAFVVVVALAFVGKHSAPLFVPVWLALALLPPKVDGPRSEVDGAPARGPRAPAWRVGPVHRLLLVAVALLAAWGALWLVYGLRWEATAEGGGPVDIAATVERTTALRSAFERHPEGPSEEEIGRAARRARPSAADRLLLSTVRHHLLPEAYLGGLAFARLNAVARWSYLHGEVSLRGFRSFFLWGFLWKTPTVTLLALALLAVLRAGGGLRRSDLFLWLPVIVLFAAAVSSHLDIGQRHLLPLYPYLWVACGALGSWIAARLPARALPAALAVVPLSCSLVFAPPWRPQLVHPHYLAYFNELAGGPAAGSRLLVDSSLDWGQDLGRLADWLDREGAREPIGLAYFGMADPRWYGIAHRKLPGGYRLEPPFKGPPGFAALAPGALVAVSATTLRGPYLAPALRAAWAELLRDAERVTTIGRSIEVYRLAAGPGRRGTRPAGAAAGGSSDSPPPATRPR